MNGKSRFTRFLFGLGLVLVVLLAGFAAANAAIPTFGATAAEQAMVLPGDDLLPNPQVNWIHAETINAAPAEVWPWIAQMADDRAGFYSYTFIEKMFDPRPGLYVNADRIHPEWQNPAEGQGLISSSMRVAAVQPGSYLLGSADPAMGMGWTWLWHISPTPSGQTRLNVHMKIQVAQMDSPIFTTFMNLGAFIMERNMMTGLKTRAEGGGEPTWIEPAEIAIWAAALIIGLIAAVSYVRRPGRLLDGARLLGIGLLAVIALIVFTFVQPAVWLRAIVDLVLLGGLIWAFGAEPAPAAEAAAQPGQ